MMTMSNTAATGLNSAAAIALTSIGATRAFRHSTRATRALASPQRKANWPTITGTARADTNIADASHDEVPNSSRTIRSNDHAATAAASAAAP